VSSMVGWENEGLFVWPVVRPVRLIGIVPFVAPVHRSNPGSQHEWMGDDGTPIYDFCVFDVRETLDVRSHFVVLDVIWRHFYLLYGGYCKLVLSRLTSPLDRKEGL